MRVRAEKVSVKRGPLIDTPEPISGFNLLNCADIDEAIKTAASHPIARFGTPGFGASTVQDWFVEGGHMAERCAGFIIIALGESIVVTCATFAELDWTGANITAFVTAFVGSVAMWVHPSGDRRAPCVS